MASESVVSSDAVATEVEADDVSHTKALQNVVELVNFVELHDATCQTIVSQTLTVFERIQSFDDRKKLAYYLDFD